MAENENVSLAELRQKEAKKSRFGVWLRKVWPALFDWKSLFWYFWFIFVLGIFWMFYSFFFNSGTQMFAWGDYTTQYCNLCYGFWDVWHDFFKTGVFELYSTSTFFGTDNIGSNAYYGLFDPFDFFCVLLPRSLVPQNMALAACLKGCVGAFACRAYLKYLGVSEKGSRIGGAAYAFNGYLNFMAGFPSTVSVVAFAPLILLGIEKVIKERKPSTLVFSLMVMGMASFFFLVVFCIFGVFYALWRYFWTIGKRNWKQNLGSIAVGIGAFAVGIMLCSWIWIPCVRESSLSPRVSSVGAAYLSVLKGAFADKDFGQCVHLIFELVGENPGRELQGLVGFLYPTCGYKYLPLYETSGGYDSWTASLFVYTPLAIFFFGALITSVRNKRWDHIIAFLICVTMVFTIFPYFFFYAFAGDGYGRWYIVLVPIIVYYACSEFDNLKSEPRWQLPTASLIELSLTVLAWVLVIELLKKKSFSSPNGLTYYPSSFSVPAEENGLSLQFVVYYQMALVVVEGFVMSYLRDKEYFWKVVIAFVSVETIVCGNLAFATSGITVYESNYNGGTTIVAAQRNALASLKEYDGGDYRIYNDSETSANTSNALGYNGSRTFHSLYNYGLSDLLRQSHILTCEYMYDTYGGNKRVNSTWSGQYLQKRARFDAVTGFKYYMIVNDGYTDGDYVAWDDDDFNYNVPFGSQCVVKTEKYRIYESPYCPDLGFGVDTVYPLGNDTVTSAYSTNFTNYYDNGDFAEIQRNEATYLDAAIIDDADVDEVSQTLSVSAATTSPTGFKRPSYRMSVVTTPDGYGFHASDPGSFLSDPSVMSSIKSIGLGDKYDGDDQKVLIYPSSGLGDYFNGDEGGAYFEMTYYLGSLGGVTIKNPTRVYFIGDTYNDDGTIREENATLNYEYYSIRNTQYGEIGGSSYDNLYGFYASGRVKYIVFCGMSKGKGNTHMPSKGLNLGYIEKSDFDAKYASLADQEHAVTDVAHSTDQFTCKTDFSTSKFVVTHIGYDAGWGITARLEDGSTEPLRTYRVDGGLVGFIAPAGATSYVLRYETPYIKVGFALSTAGIVMYFTYEIAVLAYGVRKEQKALGIDYRCRPTGKGKKKKRDGDASSPPPTSRSNI
jgi:hypothetical protein